MKRGRKTVGHPVDVASGVVYTTAEDISIPGKVDLVWERHYNTALLEQSTAPLGPGWITPYFATLTRIKEGYRLFSPEGDVEIFSDPDGLIDRGDVVRNLGTFQELTRQGSRYIVTRWGVDAGAVERLVFVRGKAGAAWPLAAMEDLTGQGLDLLYNRNGRLSSIRQRLEKRSLVLEYNANERITSVGLQLANGRQRTLARYEYDGSGRLIAAYDAVNNADRYEYDSAHRLSREAAKGAGAFCFEYDETGRCRRTGGADGYDRKTFNFLEHLGWTEVTDSLGNVRRYQYNEAGQMVQEISPLGGVKATDYDEHGRIIEEIDPNGASAKYGYDDLGNRNLIVDPLGKTIKIEFNEHHQPIISSNQLGDEWKAEYDERGRLAATADPVERRWAYSYDGKGNLNRMRGPTGYRIDLEYNAQGDNIRLTDWRGQQTSYVWDDEGRMTGRKNALGHEIGYSYNDRGEVEGVRWPDGFEIKLGYHASGQVHRGVDENGRTVTYDYDAYGRRISCEDVAGNQIKFVWGTEPNRLLEVINERGETFRLEYDDDGRVVREISFDGRERKLAYDAADNLIEIETARGVIKLQRDLLGRVVEKILPDGAVETYTYDERGYLTEAVNDTCRVSQSYDAVGRKLEESIDELTVQSVYGPWGREQRIAPWGSVTEFEYDVDDQRGIRLANGQRLRWDLDPIGRIQRRELPGGVEEHFQLDSRDRLVEQQLIGPNKRTVLHRSYKYDPSGQILNITDQRAGSKDYSYNNQDRLTGVFGEGGVVEQFKFDLTGNIVLHIGKDSRHTFNYSAGNRLTARISDGNGRINYEYDDDGNRIARQVTDAAGEDTTKFEYDGQGRLIAVESSRNDRVVFAYDALGRRVSKSGPRGKTEFIWEDYELLAERHTPSESPPGPYIEYLFNNFQPVCRLEAQDVYIYHNDHIGSPRELTDAEGNIVWAVNQTAYGRDAAVDVKNVDNHVRFRGQYLDEETGLHYNVFRYYDPETGQYITPDPFGLDGGANLYGYARNPTGYVDPLGLIDFPYTTPGGNTIPEYGGKKTSGVYVPAGGSEQSITSGYGGSSKNTCGIPGMNGNIKSHVEAHAATNMRRGNVTNATLYINQKPCSGTRGCGAMLESMLPEGAKLRVLGPDGYDKTFTGKPDPKKANIKLNDP